MIAGLLGYFALLMLIGVLGSFLLEGRGVRPLAERLAEAPMLGAMLLGSTLLWLLVVMDRFAVQAVVWLPLALAVAWVARGVLRRGRPEAAAPALASGDGARLRPMDLLFPIAALGLTASLMITAWTSGLAGDFLGIWSFKAMVLHEQGSLRIPDFQDETRFHYHQAYPLLFPCLQAEFYRLSGGIADITSKLLYPLLLCSTSLALYFRLLRRSGPAAAWAGGGLCLALPYIAGDGLGGISSGYMDIPLGCFVLLAHLAARDWMDDGRLAPALRAGLFLTAAALTKNEGVVAAGITVLLLALYTLRAGWARRGKGLLCVLLPLLVIAGTWYVYRRALPQGPQDYMGSLFGEALWRKGRHLPMVAGRFLQEVVDVERWGYLWILCLATLPRWFRGNGWVPALYLAAMSVVYALALTFSALEIHYQVDSTLDRLLAQMVPLAAAMVGLAIGREPGTQPGTQPGASGTAR